MPSGESVLGTGLSAIGCLGGPLDAKADMALLRGTVLSEIMSLQNYHVHAMLDASFDPVHDASSKLEAGNGAQLCIPDALGSLGCVRLVLRPIRPVTWS